MGKPEGEYKMKKVMVIKKAASDMMQVNGPEFAKLNGLSGKSISVSQFDKESVDFSSEDVIGYVAGDISWISETGINQDQDGTRDLWFVNLEYFAENYQEL